MPERKILTSPFSRKSIFLLAAILALSLALPGASSSTQSASSERDVTQFPHAVQNIKRQDQAKVFTPASGVSRAQEGIERFTRAHEQLKMDPARVAETVRRTGRFSLITPKQSFDLDLVPNDLRAADYRAEEVGDNGSVRQITTEHGSHFQGNRAWYRWNVRPIHYR